MKLQITVSDELVEQIDNYAKMMGISRSALCATWIGQGVMTYNKSYQMIDNLQEQFRKNMLESIQDDSKKDKEEEINPPVWRLSGLL